MNGQMPGPGSVSSGGPPSNTGVFQYNGILSPQNQLFGTPSLSKQPFSAASEVNPAVGVANNQTASWLNIQAPGSFNRIANTTPIRRPRPSIAAPNQIIAKLIVGEDKIIFTVHSAQLCYESGFFRNCLRGDFKEALEQTVLLKDENPDVVEYFIHWLYHFNFPGKHPLDDEALVHKWKTPEAGGLGMTRHLIEMYVFGEKYDIVQLKKHALNALFSHLELGQDMSMPPAELVLYAFERVSSTSALRRYLIDHRCQHGNNSKESMSGNWPIDFLYGVMDRYAHILSKIKTGDMRTDYKLSRQDYKEQEPAPES